jgi:hypothetical protein
MQTEEIKELTHKPVDGYRPTFLVILAVSVIYLVLIFFKTAGAF